MKSSIRHFLATVALFFTFLPDSHRHRARASIFDDFFKRKSYVIQSAHFKDVYLRAPGKCYYWGNNYRSDAVNGQWGHQRGERFYLVSDSSDPSLIYIEPAFREKPSVGAWEFFGSDRTVCYVSADCSYWHGVGRIGQSRDKGRYEQFRKIDNDDGTVSFQAVQSGDYLQLDGSDCRKFDTWGCGASKCAPTIGWWEKFIVFDPDEPATTTTTTTTSTTTSASLTTTPSSMYMLSSYCSFPYDSFEPIASCDNSLGLHDTKCSYLLFVGISEEGSPVDYETTAEIVSVLASSLQVSVTTGFNWSTLAPDTLPSPMSQVAPVEFTASPGQKTVIEQVTANCGHFTVRLPHVRRRDAAPDVAAKNTSSSHKQRMLLKASADGNERMLSELLSIPNIDVNWQGLVKPKRDCWPLRHSTHALSYAVACNQSAAVVGKLIQAGSSSTLCESSDKLCHRNWPLVAMASVQGNVASLRFLVRSGAGVNVLTPNQTTALIESARRGSVEIVRFLLENGADISVKIVGSDLPGAVHVAIAQDWPDVVELLLKKGAAALMTASNKSEWLALAAGRSKIVDMLTRFVEL